MAIYADIDAARAALADSGLAQADLASIAQYYPALRPQVALHPQAYDGLLGWLEQVGDDTLKSIVAARRAAPPAAATPATPATPAPSPAPADTAVLAPADTAPLGPTAPAAPDLWMAPPAYGAPAGFTAPAPDYATPSPLAPGYANPDFGNPAAAPLAPVPYAPVSAAPPTRKKGGKIILGVAGLAVVGGLVAGGIALFKDGGLTGPPILDDDQFTVLATETLPDEANLQALSVDLNSSNPGLLGQICPTVTSEGIEADADGRVDLVLFDTAERAQAYVEGVASCLTKASEWGIADIAPVTVDGVYILDIKIVGVTTTAYAQYGNVVVGAALWDGDWEAFAVKDFKPAVDAAAK